MLIGVSEYGLKVMRSNGSSSMLLSNCFDRIKDTSDNKHFKYVSVHREVNLIF